MGSDGTCVGVDIVAVQAAGPIAHAINKMAETVKLPVKKIVRVWRTHCLLNRFQSSSSKPERVMIATVIA